MNAPRQIENNNTMPYEISPQYFQPTTGQTVNVQNSTASFIDFLIDPAGTLATLTIVMPTTPFGGQRVSMCSTKIVTTLTLQAGVAGGTFNITASTIAANAAIEFVYYANINKWIRFAQTP